MEGLLDNSLYYSMLIIYVCFVMSQGAQTKQVQTSKKSTEEESNPAKSPGTKS